MLLHLADMLRFVLIVESEAEAWPHGTCLEAKDQVSLEPGLAYMMVSCYPGRRKETLT